MAGPFLAVAFLVVLSGALKITAPAAAGDSLSGLGVPAAQVVARLVGVGEMALGLLAVMSGGRFVALALGLAYLGFAAVAELLRRRTDDGGSCGCFGKADTPPSVIHTSVNLLAAAVALAAVVWPVPDIVGALEDQAAAGALGDVVFIGLVLLGTYLLYLAFTVLPQLFSEPTPQVETFHLTTGGEPR